MQQITEIQLKALNKERETILKELPELQRKLSAAAALGDMKENAEYDAVKQDIALRHIRLSQIDTTLNSCEVITASDGDRLTVGSIMKISIINSDGTETEPKLFLLDSVEKILEGILGIESPLGKVINGNPSGIYEVQTPLNKRIKYRVVKQEASMIEKFMEEYPDGKKYFE